MLTILNDPAGITGRRRIPWGSGTVFEQIARAMPEGGGGCEVRFNGEIVEPLTDPRMNRAPADGDEVAVINRPAGVETWILVASFVLAAYSYTLIPKPTDQPQQTDSPNNRLTAQTNIARAYQAIPDVYGRRRCWPDLIQPSTVEYISNVKVITEWLCISRGKGTVSEIRYADTPIDDIDGWRATVFEPSATPDAYPENNDTTLEDVYEAFEAPEVNGQEIADSPSSLVAQEGVISTTSGSGVFTFLVGGDISHWQSIIDLEGTGSASITVINGAEPFSAVCTVDNHTFDGTNHTFTFTRPTSFAASNTETVVANFTPVGGGSARGPFTLGADADQIWCNFVFARGLVGTVEVEAEWWAINSAGVEISGTRQTASRTFEASSYDQQGFTWKIIPSAGLRRYRIQFTRLTPDLGNGADVCKLEEVYAVRYYATKTLPGVTVMRTVRRATTQALGGQDLRFNVIFERHVRTLTTTTLSASRNFARALVHLWAIHGYSVTEWDTSALAAINTALGEDSPFLRFDWSFDDANLSIGERLQIAANAARCLIWRDGTLWTATRDQAKSAPELQLDYRNLAAGGESGISYAAHLPGSEDGVELEYIDEDTQATKEYVRLDVSGGSVVVGSSARPKKIKLLGCATALQALNRAELEARKLLYQRTSVTDTALADAASLGPGALVRWIDPHDFYGDAGLQAGEVLAIAGDIITTSESLQWGAETSGRILFTGADGLHIASPVVCTPVAPFRVQLSSVPGGLYLRDDATRQLGSRYAFGAGLTEAEIEAAGLFTVTQLRPTSDRTVEVSLVNYDERIYEGDYSVGLLLASEADQARPIAPNVAALARASESDAALPVSLYVPPVISAANEFDSARPITISTARAWNPSDKDADITLSEANATASITATAQGVVRGVTGRDASGDHYFEVTVGGTDGRAFVGIAKSTASLTNYPGQDADGYGYIGVNGQKITNASGVAYGATWTAGDVIGVRLNAGTLTFYKNGVSQGSAYTGLTGTFFAAWGTETAVAGTRTGKLNAGREAFLSLPSGATAWG